MRSARQICKADEEQWKLHDKEKSLKLEKKIKELQKLSKKKEEIASETAIQYAAQPNRQTCVS
jgi:hypothetical protein